MQPCVNKTGSASELTPQYDVSYEILLKSDLLLPGVIVFQKKKELAFQASDSTGVMLIGSVTFIVTCQNAWNYTRYQFWTHRKLTRCRAD